MLNGCRMDNMCHDKPMIIMCHGSNNRMNSTRVFVRGNENNS